MKTTLFTLVVLFVLLVSPSQSREPRWQIEVTDLRSRDKLVILVFGDSGTGKGGQYRVGSAMYEVCSERGCHFALMLGDNIYDNGIEVRNRTDREAT